MGVTGMDAGFCTVDLGNDDGKLVPEGAGTAGATVAGFATATGFGDVATEFAGVS